MSGQNATVTIGLVGVSLVLVGGIASVWLHGAQIAVCIGLWVWGAAGAELERQERKADPSQQQGEVR